MDTAWNCGLLINHHRWPLTIVHISWSLTFSKIHLSVTSFALEVKAEWVIDIYLHELSPYVHHAGSRSVMRGMGTRATGAYHQVER